MKGNNRNSGVIIIILTAVAITAALSIVPWGRLTGNILKDFNLLGDLMPSNAAEYATLEVMYPGAEYEKLDITNDVIAGAYEAKGQGYAFKCTGKGYHEMTILIGLDYDGTIISVIPLEHQETSGFGAELFKDDAIASLYVGKTLDQEVDSRAGATLTSKAMVTMTNACKEAYKSIK